MSHDQIRVFCVLMISRQSYFSFWSKGQGLLLKWAVLKTETILTHSDDDDPAKAETC